MLPLTTERSVLTDGMPKVFGERLTVIWQAAVYSLQKMFSAAILHQGQSGL